MNKQFKLSLLAASLVTAFAANVAYAGNVASSNPQVAREVITSDLQEVLAPEASYAFQGALNLQSQDQTMQIQVTLTGGGKWKTPVANSIRLYQNDGVTPIAELAAPVTPTVSADGKTLFATLTFTQAAGVIYNNPVVRFNPAGTQSSLTELYSVVGKVEACDTKATQLPFEVKHFTGVAPGSTVMAVDGVNGALEDESKRNGSNNKNTLMSFPTNLGLTFASSAPDAKIDATVAGTKFKGTTGSYISATLANLGTLTLKQQADGYDSNLINKYRLDNAAAPAGVKGVATAGVNNGAVEVERVTVDVTASQGFAAGSSVFLNSNANCGAGTIIGTAVTTFTDNIAKLVIPTAAVNAAFGAAGTTPVHVCYQVSGSSLIPSSSFTAAGTLVKAPGTLPNPEQNNACNGPLYSLAGAIKIDVRNYASSKDPSGWGSVVRIINPSETNTALVYGQLIHENGAYGGWGKLADLKPRAVINLPAAAIDAKLTNNPDAGAANNGAVGSTGKETGDRLRITAEGVSSLRVQTYLYNTISNSFIEVSGSQGVDYDGNLDRAPVNEGQYISQDAQAGLNGKN